MKKNQLFISLLIVSLFSCNKDDSFPRVENTTSGKKWTLQIGSSPIEVYSQLQELGKEKNFGAVNVTYRKPYSKPEDIQNHLGFYHAITLQSNSGIIERAVILFEQNKVSVIETGGALLDDASKWPQDTSDEIAIQIDDSIDKVYEKLLAIYEIPTYSDYQIILPDKSLEKPFDPDMANYDEWAFGFVKNVSGNIFGTSLVSLFFKNNKLFKIRHQYNENEMVNSPFYGMIVNDGLSAK